MGPWVQPSAAQNRSPRPQRAHSSTQMAVILEKASSPRSGWQRWEVGHSNCSAEMQKNILKVWVNS